MKKCAVCGVKRATQFGVCDDCLAQIRQNANQNARLLKQVGAMEKIPAEELDSLLKSSEQAYKVLCNFRDRGFTYAKTDIDQLYKDALSVLKKSRAYYAPSNSSVNSAPTPVNRDSSEQSSISLPDTFCGLPLQYKYDDVAVAGSQYYNPGAIKVGDVVSFLAEPNNEYDAKAVAILVNDVKIGHLHKNNLQSMFHDFINRGGSVYARISEINSDEIKMVMGFYENSRNAIEKEYENDFEKLVESGAKYKSFRLSGNKNEEMQENIYLSSVGDSVAAFYEAEKEKYLAIGPNDIGYFPKSAEEYLENEFDAFIEDIETDDDGNYIVKVAVFPQED